MKKNCPQKRCGHKTFGFTLIETLVSLGTLLLFFLVLVSTFSLVTNLVGGARVRLVAIELAQEKLEEIRNLAYDDVGTVGGIPSGVLEQNQDVEINGQTFQVQIGVLYIDDTFDGVAPDDVIAADYKRARVSVSWEGAFAPKNPVVLLTDVVPNGLESIVGGGTLFVSVINSVGEPVSGANVSIKNSSVVPEIDLETTSDSGGRVVLPGAPVCVDCYEISVTKSGYTTDRTYSTSEVANPLKPDATMIEGEVTSLTLQIDQAARINILTTGSRASNYPAFSGVQFRLHGSRIIGTNTLDEPILKYDENLSSGPGGVLAISNLEWDTYEVEIPNPSSVDLAGTYPLSPMVVLPGANINLTIVTQAATANNLLVVVKNIAGQGVATASATIQRSGFIATASAGIAGKGDQGQVLFPSLVPATYNILIKQVGYKEATASAAVSGDSKQIMTLEGL